MGRDSKNVQLVRISQLAEVMKIGDGYASEYDWYFKMYGKSERSFQKDRTEIYKQWKIDFAKEIEIDKIDLLNKIAADRKLARDSFNASAAIQADKLEAQIKGHLNKQGESSPTVNVNNNTLSVEGLTVAEIKELLYGT
jgi:hypothetical protein